MQMDLVNLTRELMNVFLSVWFYIYGLLPNKDGVP